MYEILTNEELNLISGADAGDAALAGAISGATGGAYLGMMICGPVCAVGGAAGGLIVGSLGGWGIYEAGLYYHNKVHGSGSGSTAPSNW